MIIKEFVTHENGVCEHTFAVNWFQRMAIRFLFRFILRNSDLDPDTWLYIATDRKSIEHTVIAEENARKQREEKRKA